MRNALAMGLVAVAAATGGCGSHVAPPTFELADVYTLPPGPDGRVVVFVIEGVNNSHAQLPLRDVQYTVRLNGAEAVTARRTAEATLPARGSQTIELPAPLAGADAPLGPYTLEGSVEYQLPGVLADLMFDSDIRRPRARFSFSGALEEPAPAPPG